MSFLIPELVIITKLITPLLWALTVMPEQGLGLLCPPKGNCNTTAWEQFEGVMLRRPHTFGQDLTFLNRHPPFQQIWIKLHSIGEI